MLRARLATAAVAIPLLLLVILYGPTWLFAVVVGVIGLMGIGEYAFMAFPKQLGERGLTMLLGAAVLAGCLCGIGPYLAAALAFSVAAALVWALFARPDFENGLRDVALSLIGIFYVGFLAPHFVWLHNLDRAEGPLWVVFVLLIGMAGDTGGYAVGHLIGRHKLMPRVSPGKTVEGALGIMASSLLGGVIAKLVFLGPLSWTQVLSLATIMAVLGQLGDLSESVMKRTFGVKESGWLFPGHGGVLDRIDSLLFPVAFLYYYLALSR